MSASIVPVDTSSEVAVTGYLQQARDWLANAVETSTPAMIANAKAEIATAAEATKQLNLSKEIQLDAQEMVRRAEYALGKAIRKGQAEGSVRSRGQIVRHFNRWGGDVHDTDNSTKASPEDFAPMSELSGSSGNGIYALADGADDDSFDKALDQAKAEGDLSRANVVRKIRGQTGQHETRDQRADIIRKLAAEGWSSSQMTDRVGIAEQAVRQIARDYGIGIPADRALNKQRRVNSNDVVENLVIGLEGSVMSLDLINRDDIDRERAADWASSLSESLRKLNRFAKQIKEMTQ